MEPEWGDDVPETEIAIALAICETCGRTVRILRKIEEGYEAVCCKGHLTRVRLANG